MTDEVTEDGNREPDVMADCLDRMIKLFVEFRESFGLCDADFPDMNPQNKQCEFEIKFAEIICDYKGHDIGPDHCCKPEHDLCYRCKKLRVDIEREEPA